MVEREEVEVTSRAEWRAWLADNHHRSSGIWLVTWKKSAGAKHVPYGDLVEEALCFGWVDSQARGVDAERSSITMTPRRPRSGWSKPNRDRIERLEAAGLMHPAGATVVAAARTDGSWEMLMGIEQLIEPAPLAAALDADAEARRGWELLPRSARRATLQQLLAVKRDETMARRVAAIVAEARARAAADSPAARSGPVADSAG